MIELLKKKAISLGATDLKRSNRKNKKYVVTYNNENIHFGDKRYDDFTVHKDKERRDRFLARASKIRNKEGQLTYKLKSSPNYWAVNLLW